MRNRKRLTSEISPAQKELKFIMAGFFHPPEVVDRGNETQLEVGEYLNLITWRVKG